MKDLSKTHARSFSEQARSFTYAVAVIVLSSFFGACASDKDRNGYVRNNINVAHIGDNNNITINNKTTVNVVEKKTVVVKQAEAERSQIRLAPVGISSMPMQSYGVPMRRVIIRSSNGCHSNFGGYNSYRSGYHKIPYVYSHQSCRRMSSHHSSSGHSSHHHR